MIPPALMQNGAYNMNQTIINSVFPTLIPLIARANADIVTSVIDVYTGTGNISVIFFSSALCELKSAIGAVQRPGSY